MFVDPYLEQILTLDEFLANHGLGIYYNKEEAIMIKLNINNLQV